jgi:alkyldihydroxyacetonephosphate synthase
MGRDGGVRPPLHRDLVGIVGEGAVASDTETLARYGGDALGVFRAFHAAPRLEARAHAVAWPTSAGQVARLLRYADANRIPVVPYGGGTGVMGAATPVDSAIVLNLRRMDRIIEISEADVTARLQPGVILQDAHVAMKRSGLRLGHDPWSRPIATVGGAISTDGVGYTTAAHGSMGQQVLGLEVALANGELVRTRAVPKPTAGPSLDQLFIGSEGTLGVITEATIRVIRAPEERFLRSYVFPEFESGFNAVVAMLAQGVMPGMIDYGDELLTGDRPSSEEATLYLAFEGFPGHVHAHAAQAASICGAFGGRAGEPGDAERNWRQRHSSAETYRREVLDGPDPAARRRQRSAHRMDYLHVGLPISKVLEYRRLCMDIFQQRGILVREWSIWGRPEFFSFLMVEREDAGESSSLNLSETVDEVLGLAQRMGGSMEYCHGVGVKLSHLMQAELGTGAPAARRIKSALDPNNILNPGKLFI